MGMPHSDSEFTSDVASFYDDILVPLIFEAYGQDLAERTRLLMPGTVLEVACGTGVVTRALAKTLPADAEITATDLNGAMVAHAQSLGAHREVTWREADVMSLPFADDSFDVVVCQFAVMFFPDRVAAYREVRRVLRPGGSFLFSTWNGIDRNEFAAEVTRALGVEFPADPPSFLPRTPHGYWDVARIESDLQGAGFTTMSAEQKDEVSRATDAIVPATAYCQGTPLRGEIVARDPGGLQRCTDLAAAAVAQRFGEGPIESSISATVVAAS